MTPQAVIPIAADDAFRHHALDSFHNQTVRHLNGRRNGALLFDTNNQFQESTMKLAIAGGAVVDAAHFNESLLEIITRRLRTSWRNLIDTLNQPGRP